MTSDQIKSHLPPWLVNSKTFSAIVTDLEGNYLYVNDIFQQRFAWMTDDFVGEPFATTVHPEDVENCNQVAYECMNNPGKIVNVKIRKPVDDQGMYQWTEWEFSSFHDEEDNLIGLFCLGYDITELKEFTAESIIAKFKLNDIAQIQSHEVRAPVASILGLVNLMMDETDPNVNMDYLMSLKKSAHQLDQIIHKVIGLTID